MTRVRVTTRAGHIQYHTNRFCGADVYATIEPAIRIPTELVLMALGGRALDDSDREVLRFMALSLTSPDARVWPLKLTRLLAAHGNVFAGFYGAQLANDTDKMGPGTGSGGAEALTWIDRHLGGADPDDGAAVAAAVTAYRAAHGRIAGFGVPFRPEDERAVHLTRLLQGHPVTRRRPWRLHLAVAAAVRASNDLPNNVVLPLVALALDLGVPPRRVGLFMSLTMIHTFAAHAVESSEAGEVLRVLPVEALDYQGASPRFSPAAAREADQAAMR